MAWRLVRLALAGLAPVIAWAVFPLTIRLMDAVPRAWRASLTSGFLFPWPSLAIYGAAGLLVVAAVLAAFRLDLGQYLLRGFGYFCAGAATSLVVLLALFFLTGAEDCSYPESAEWVQPGLYAFAGGAPGWSSHPAADGIEFVNGTLPWPATLQDLRYGSHFDPLFQLDGQGRATLVGDWNATAFRQFVAGVSSANNDTVAAWAGQVERHANATLAPLDRLAGLVHNLTASAADPHGTQGMLDVRQGPWTATFSLPVRERSAGYVLRVDAADHATFSGMQKRGGEPFSAYAGRVVARLSSEGIPAPPASALLVGGAIC